MNLRMCVAIFTAIYTNLGYKNSTIDFNNWNCIEELLKNSQNSDQGGMDVSEGGQYYAKKGASQR